MSEALREYFTKSRGIRTKEEVTRWIGKHYPKKWAAGTLRDHLYGGRVNHPLAYKHHPGQKKFLFDNGEKRGRRYERYDAAKHGFFRNGYKVAGSAPQWILIHNQERYRDADPDNPMDELAKNWPLKNWDRLWHWKRPNPLQEDSRPRTLLLAWKQCVFGEVTATVTHEIGDVDPERFNFAFRLLDYRPLRVSIPFGALGVGKHRDLIRLNAKIWKAYEAAKSGDIVDVDAGAVADMAQAEAEIEAAVNPQKKGKQGFGLTTAEKKCVERYAMDLAMAHLDDEDFSDIEDVSDKNPFDITANRDGKIFSIEVKGTTTAGAEILLTKNEVQHHLTHHPDNMLIVVHSISLKRGTDPIASGGELRAFHPWLLEKKKLKPYAYSYVV